jgi:cobalamin biosynthesis Mg chelatase CobN
MRTILKTALFALLLLVAPAVSMSAASAAPQPAQAAPAQAGAVHAGAAQAGDVQILAGNTPTPSPGDTASTGPANPGTGESAQNESTRLDWTPWVIAGIAVVVLILILIWRRRRNTTFVG